MKEEKKKDEKISYKKGFFQKAKLSIFNIEKYPELAVEGVPRAITYLVKLVAILVLVLCISMIVTTSKNIKEGVNYLEKEFPNFSYKDGILNVETDKEIKTENDDYLGKVIIDTKTDNEEIKNQYINEITEHGFGLLILKDKMILKNTAIMGTTTFEFKELMGQMGITEFVKQDLINYANSSLVYSIYFSLFIVIFIYGFMISFITTLLNVLLISLFGNLAGMISKVKMRYAAIFNMSIYAITLSTLLNIIYIFVNIFTDFQIQYFDVMYIAVATIYLFAAIFIIKDDLIKKQVELMKIAKVQDEVRKELQEKKNNEEKKDEKKEEEKKSSKENENAEDEKDNNIGEQPEGGKA